jgi:hypothetical protein
MKYFKPLSSSLIRFGKGMILIYAILFIGVLVFQSCKKDEVKYIDGAAEKFLSSVKKHSSVIKSIQVNHVNKAISNYQSTNQTFNTQYNNNDEQFAYITFSDVPTNPQFSYDINGMANLIINYSGNLSFQPADSSFTFLIPVSQVTNSLNPLIVESKLYLNSRGLTNADIDDMLAEEGGQEVDLIPFATGLAEYEKSGEGLIGYNYLNLIATSAYAARSVSDCIMIALGVDAIWALGGSNAKSWSKSAIKKAFGSVAKRFLGPVGVAITVTSFGLCMGNWHP